MNLIIKNHVPSLVKLNFAPATEFNVESETVVRFIIPAK